MMIDAEAKRGFGGFRCDMDAENVDCKLLPARQIACFKYQITKRRWTGVDGCSHKFSRAKPQRSPSIERCAVAQKQVAERVGSGWETAVVTDYHVGFGVWLTFQSYGMNSSA